MKNRRHDRDACGSVSLKGSWHFLPASQDPSIHLDLGLALPLTSISMAAATREEGQQKDRQAEGQTSQSSQDGFSVDDGVLPIRGVPKLCTLMTSSVHIPFPSLPAVGVIDSLPTSGCVLSL